VQKRVNLIDADALNPYNAQAVQRRANVF